AWDEHGRRAFHFRTDAPIPNQFVIASARYAVARATHGDVAIEVYHHPEHTQNVARIAGAASESLRTFEESFGPYPHPHLRFAEVPAQLRNYSAFALPGVIFLGENRGFLVDARDPRRLDLVHRRVAHEVAHQWWGYTLIPLNVPGATAITESLAKYAELIAIEKTYGRERVRQSLTYELDRYLAERTSERGSEPPLARAGGQPYLYYRKGALVMYALKDLLGERAVNAALRDLLREHGGPRGRPTTAHLVQHLRANSAPDHHPLIDQWLNDVVLYDLKLASATSRKRADGRYDVTIRVAAAKHRESGADRTPLPLAEEIELGLFSADDTPLHVAKHRIRGGVQEITLVAGRAPAFAAVDPYVTRIDVNRFDNLRGIDR
ncbi:MAG TPA: M1 family aminopeptidase, partial [Thermoanaerobaculia bacterium]|nr:M1 family aminopeptidase [Thermoanaerobaculia bacterium]